MNNKKSKRKHPRLKHYDYSKAGYYYVTICVSERKNLLSRISFPDFKNEIKAEDIKIELSNIGKIANTYILGISHAYESIVLDRYIIMPDHIHLIIFIKPHETTVVSKKISIFTVIHALKRLITKDIGYNIWQESFYEHVIRDEEELYNARKYINDNPLRWYYKNKR